MLGGAADAPRPDEPSLTATAVALVDASGRRAILVHADLHSAGQALRLAVLRRCPGVRSEELVIAATHTHLGPGFYYGSPLFDAMTTARPWPLPANVNRLGEALAAAVRQALDDLAPGGVTWLDVDVPGVASNRSLAAHHRNPQPLLDAFAAGPGRAVAELPDLADRCVDPRLRLLVVGRGEGTPIGALGWFACHGTALGAGWPRWSAEWAGYARVAAEAHLGVPLGLAGGATADTSPMPLDADGAPRTTPSEARPAGQGEALARWIGERVGRAATRGIAAARPEPFEVALASTAWEPARDGLQARYGLATLGGAVDGAKGVHDGPWALYAQGVDAPGYRSDLAFSPGSDQHPKVDASLHLTGGWLRAGALIGALAPRVLPLHVLRIGDGMLATVPGEPSTLAAFTLERALCAEARCPRAVISGYAGTYAGYWTTPQEYDLQRYEGASTLYGRRSLTVLRDRLIDLARTLTAPRPP